MGHSRGSRAAFFLLAGIFLVPLAGCASMMRGLSAGIQGDDPYGPPTAPRQDSPRYRTSDEVSAPLGADERAVIASADTLIGMAPESRVVVNGRTFVLDCIGTVSAIFYGMDIERYLIEKEGLRPDFAVSTEPTSCRLYRGHRGRMEIEARVRGISAHGSAPERGESAAYKAARAAIAMEKLNERLAVDEFLGKGTVVVSKIDVHGPSQCAVPDQGILYLDRRLTWGETAELAIAQVKEAMSTDAESVAMPVYEGKGWHGASYVQDLYFPTWKIPEDHPLVAGGRDGHRSLFGRDPEVGKWTFSTNGVAICGKHGIPCIGFGPGDEDKAHAPNEHTRVDDLVVASAFYAMLPVALEKSGR